jgi:hypothetical protein
MASKQVAVKSSGMVHIYSTLANPQKFVTYLMPDAADANQMGRLPVIDREVLIRGGAGIASKNLITPLGVHTAITADEYESIRELPHFQAFVKSGHFRVENKSVDIDKIVGDMNPRDPGGPVTPADYETAKKDGSEAIPVELDKAGTGWVANQVTNR